MINCEWKGEPEYLRAFGPEGLKAVVQVMLDELNELRTKNGLPAKAHGEILSAMIIKISDNQGDIKT